MKKRTSLLLSLALTFAFLFYLLLSFVFISSPGISVHPTRTVPTADMRIDINNAPADELQLLPGIGPVLADAIVSWRETHGSFSSANELLEVPGIGGKTVNTLRDYITTGGTA